MKRFWQDDHGFSLLETALVLAIMGVVAGSLLPALGTWLEKETLQRSRRNMDAAEEAIALFVQRNGRLPCPASPIGDPAVGLEDALPQATTTPKAEGEPAPEPAPAVSVCRRTQGILPYRTLGLPQLAMVDGWSRPFRYAPEPALTMADSRSAFCAPDRKSIQAKLSIIDRTTLDVAPDFPLAYALLSHGMNGEGAWLLGTNQEQQEPIVTPAEPRNSDGDFLFVLSDTPLESDDDLRWRTAPRVWLSAMGAGCSSEEKKEDEMKKDAGSEDDI
jgi:prepilin-type N-terminal cleavage/methylation domain-containing protein